MTWATLLSGAVAVVPWLFGLGGLGVLALFSIQVGLPQARIQELKARVRLLELRLETAEEEKKGALAREERCIEHLKYASEQLADARRDLHTAMDALAVRDKLDKLAAALQPLAQDGVTT